MLTVGTMPLENGQHAYKSENFYRHVGALKRLQCLRFRNLRLDRPLPDEIQQPAHGEAEGDVDDRVLADEKRRDADQCRDDRLEIL